MRISSRLGLFAALILATGGLTLAAIAGADGGATVREGVYDTDPPRTKITDGPKKETKKNKARFEFKSSEPGSTFVCKLDKDPFETCESPATLKRLKAGKHKFKVSATDASGNADPSAAAYRWKIVD